MRQKPIIVSTLGDLQDRGQNLVLSCDLRHCHRPIEDALDALIAEFGRDREYVPLRLRCKRCGRRLMASISTPC